MLKATIGELVYCNYYFNFLLMFKAFIFVLVLFFLSCYAFCPSLIQSLITKQCHLCVVVVNHFFSPIIYSCFVNSF